MLQTLKYNPIGNQIWTGIYDGVGVPVQVESIALDSATNVYLLANWGGGFSEGYVTLKYDANGNLVWSASPNNNSYSRSRGLVVDGTHSILITGQIPSNFGSVA
jgi:hypothetical protein